MSVIHDILHRLLDARPISDLERDLFHRKLDEHAEQARAAAGPEKATSGTWPVVSSTAPVDPAQGA